VVKVLVIVTVAVYLVELAVARFTDFPYVRWFGLSAHYGVGRLNLWQFVTSLFLHDATRIFHILFNMFVLWVFGRQVEPRLGSRRFLFFYFAAGVFAGLCYVLVSAFGDPFVPAIGASGAIMAVLVLFGFLFPDAIVLAFLFIPMKAKHLVWLLVGIDLVYFFFMTESEVATSAHLGGALFGFLYFRYEPRVRRWLEGLEERDRRRTQEEARQARARVDELLAKIGRGERLTTRERRFLDQASKRYFGKD
jgi:membrane associated rhomboid family serine protease